MPWADTIAPMSDGKHPEGVIKRVTFYSHEALGQLSKRDSVHRDAKPVNFSVSKHKGHLIDLALAKETQGTKIDDEFIGILRYAPSEIIAQAI